MTVRAPSKWKTAATYVGIVVATLLVVECAARIWDWSPWNIDTGLGDNLGRWRYGQSHEGYGDLIPNQDGQWVMWFHRPYHVVTNSVGLRNSEEPSETAFRILAIGDSQTFGPYLANEDTWPAWTENYLRQQFKDTAGVQVFNAGIAGYTVSDELAYLKEKGVKFSPRLVVLAVFENDFADLRKPPTRESAREPPSRLSSVIRDISRKSALVSAYGNLRDRLKLASSGVDVRRGEANPLGPASSPGATSPGTTPDETADVSKYGGLFRDMVALLKTHNIGLAVIFIPGAGASEPTATETAVRSLSEETKTPYLDLTPILNAERDGPARLYLVQKDVKTGSYTGNGHLSREGNAVIGAAVSEWLIRKNLVPH
ncbi:MAG: SGNH/GDSL hydrolase family protein [Limisphaerales bacterium]